MKNMENMCIRQAALLLQDNFQASKLFAFPPKTSVLHRLVHAEAFPISHT